MFEKLTQADIAQARDELNRRREEILRRQAAEIGGLDAELAGVERLDRLLDAFAAKYRKAPASAPPPEPAIPAAAGQAAPTAKSGSERAQPKRIFSGSNFDSFARALSKSL